MKLVDEKDPILRSPAKPVTKFDADLRDLVNKMSALMRNEKGVGLAAPQTGDRRRVCIVFDGKDFALINPKIINRSIRVISETEGCLSFPGTFRKIIRHIWVDVEYQDIQGKKTRRRFEGLAARCAQHEIDHLDGITFETLGESVESDDRKTFVYG